MTKLWGGRFSKKTNKLVEEFTKSIDFDYKLAEYDIFQSKCHILILEEAGLLTKQEYRKLSSALLAIKKQINKKHLPGKDSFEDIHSYIQHLVEKKAKKAALKLHTCRSRNDQIVFDIKYYCQREIISIQRAILEFQKTLLNLSKKNIGLQIPGYTHLQHAIPVNLNDYLLSYHDMLDRDYERLSFILKNIKLTLGAGALAGTFIEAMNYNNAAKKFLKDSDIPGITVSENSIDTISDRDFVIEILNALAIISMHLSRLAEDMILWATKEFDFIEIDDAFCTGSSLMPQKKNPDVLELVRGYSGRHYGNLMNVLTMMKGLPLSYNRDMQLDKEPLFDSFEIMQKELGVLSIFFKNVKFKKESINKQLQDESLYATDLSDHLVKNGVPFTEVHAIIGKLFRHKYKTSKKNHEFLIRSMSTEELQKFHPLLNTKIVKKIIDSKYSVGSKKSIKRKRSSNARF